VITNTSIIVPPGFYSVQQLIDTVTALFLALTPSIILVMTYNSISNKVSINITNVGYTIKATRPSNNVGFLFELLGSDATSLAITTVVTPMLYGPKLQGEQMAYISSMALSPGNAIDEKGTQVDVLVPVMITAPYRGMNVFECKVDDFCEIIYGKPKYLSNIDIALVDHEGRILDLHGGTLNLELRMWFNTF